jgi:hypothetical protein
MEKTVEHAEKAVDGGTCLIDVALTTVRDIFGWNDGRRWRWLCYREAEGLVLVHLYTSIYGRY